MDDKLSILKMLEEGKITTEEATHLLEALDTNSNESHSKINVPSNTTITAKWLKIRVLSDEEKTKVNVNIPLSLVDIGLKIGSAYNKELQDKLSEIDIDSIIQLVQEGAEGKLAEIETEDGDVIEVCVE